MLFLSFSISWASNLRAEEPGDTYCFELSDTQEVARCLQDRTILRQLIEVKEQQIDKRQ